MVGDLNSAWPDYMERSTHDKEMQRMGPSATAGPIGTARIDGLTGDTAVETGSSSSSYLSR
jgi:hypothetical protein